MDRAAAAPGVLDAIREADVVVLPGGDPVLSIGIVLGVPGVRDALRGTSAKIVGITPDLTDLGPSLAAVGIDPTASGVAGLYRDLRVTWLPTDASPPTSSPTPDPPASRLRSASAGGSAGTVGGPGGDGGRRWR